MSKIELTHIDKYYGKNHVLKDLNLTIEDGDFMTLLGPSGCGKTTTLRMSAGLETPTSGRITIGGRVVYDSEAGINIPPNKRKVGFLFQNYALWPNMTVYQNISFGLSNVKEALPKIDFEAKNAARLAQILQTPSDVTAVLDECRDKDGKLEEKKAVLKLIDAFTLSQYTAKKLFGYHLENGADCAAAIAALAFVGAVAFAYGRETIVTWNLWQVPAALCLNALVGGPILALAGFRAARTPLGDGGEKALLALAAAALGDDQALAVAADSFIILRPAVVQRQLMRVMRQAYALRAAVAARKAVSPFGCEFPVIAKAYHIEPPVIPL